MVPVVANVPNVPGQIRRETVPIVSVVPIVPTVRGLKIVQGESENPFQTFQSFQRFQRLLWDVQRFNGSIVQRHTRKIPPRSQIAPAAAALLSSVDGLKAFASALDSENLQCTGNRPELPVVVVRQVALNSTARWIRRKISRLRGFSKE